MCCLARCPFYISRGQGGQVNTDPNLLLPSPILGRCGQVGRQDSLIKTQQHYCQVAKKGRTVLDSLNSKSRTRRGLCSFWHEDAKLLSARLPAAGKGLLFEMLLNAFKKPGVRRTFNRTDFHKAHTCSHRKPLFICFASHQYKTRTYDWNLKEKISKH